MGPVLLALALVVYNNALNRWDRFNGWPYVPLNLLAALTLLLVGRNAFGLTTAQIGFSSGFAVDAAVGVGIATGIAAPLFAMTIHPRTRPLISDARVHGVVGGELLYRTLLRIPLGTAVLEEVAFRGVLYAAWRPHGALVAAVASAVPFGLWHIAPALNLVEMNRPGVRPTRVTVGTVLAAVALTSAAGIGFAALREALGGLGGPLGLHAALNALATLAAVRADRGSKTAGSSDI